MANLKIKDSKGSKRKKKKKKKKKKKNKHFSCEKKHTREKNKQEPTVCYLQETHLRAKDTHRLKVRRWEKLFHANGKKQESRHCNTRIRQNKL